MLSERLGCERSLLFASAYAANVGILQALASIGPEVELYSDALNHASIVDGCRLAKANGARLHIFPHLDWDALTDALSRARNREKPAFLLIESLYSMDGDVPDFARARALAVTRECAAQSRASTTACSRWVRAALLLQSRAPA